jgi:hypothetical protein
MVLHLLDKSCGADPRRSGLLGRSLHNTHCCGMGSLHSRGGLSCPKDLLPQPEHVNSILGQALQKQKQGSIREPGGSRGTQVNHSFSAN